MVEDKHSRKVARVTASDYGVMRFREQLQPFWNGCSCDTNFRLAH
jgi:hypothetical protein